MVQSIAAVGLKRPITVSKRSESDTDGKLYDLVCGQGRMEAFAELGESSIPAIVIQAPEQDRQLMSLIENIARRPALTHAILAEVRLLRGRGHSRESIAVKLGIDRAYLFGICHLSAFVRIIPDGDILPCRSKFSSASNDWQVAVNHIHCDADGRNALWYSLPDVVASVILTGRVPKVIDAFRLIPSGTSPGLERISVRGAVDVDPSKEDFFKVVTEERKRVATRQTLSDAEKSRLDTHLLDFLAAYNFARRLKTLKRLTPYEYICKC